MFEGIMKMGQKINKETTEKSQEELEKAQKEAKERSYPPHLTEAEKKELMDRQFGYFEALGVIKNPEAYVYHGNAKTLEALHKFKVNELGFDDLKLILLAEYVFDNFEDDNPANEKKKKDLLERLSDIWDLSNA